jgi:hypothetical protein
VTTSNRESDADAVDAEHPRPKRIELVWPEKGRMPVRRRDGKWELHDRNSRRLSYPLVSIENFPVDEAVATQGQASLVVEGQRLLAMRALRKMISSRVKLAYFDLPRIVVDDKTRAFQGEADRVWSTYCCVVQEHLRAVLSLMSRNGVVVAQCGDAEEPYVRLIMAELFGAQNHVGTVVWQRSYAPRNQRGMKELTATHDPILIYAIEKDLLQRVALERVPQGFSNPDDDPRGEWRAVRQKGSATKRERTNFAVNVPPYR